MSLSGRGPSKLGELTRARRLTRGIGHRVNSTPDGNRHAEGGDEKPTVRRRQGGNGLNVRARLPGHAKGGTDVSMRKAFPCKKRSSVSGRERRKTGNSQVVLPLQGEILCRSLGPPSQWTDTYLVRRRYASESRSRAARPGRPATPCFQLLPAGPGSPHATPRCLCACLRARARVPRHVPACPCTCPCPSVGRSGPVGPCFLGKHPDASRAQLARSSGSWCVGSGGGAAAPLSLAFPSDWSAKR